MVTENLMYELKDCTHYYLYTNGEHIFITDKPPVRRDYNLRWYHPEIDTLKCIQTLYVDILTDQQYSQFEKYKEEKYGEDKKVVSKSKTHQKIQRKKTI